MLAASSVHVLGTCEHRAPTWGGAPAAQELNPRPLVRSEVPGRGCNPPRGWGRFLLFDRSAHCAVRAGMIEDEDLLAVTTAPAKGRGRGRKAGGAPTAPRGTDAAQLLADMSGLSARERAAAMRRAKSGLKRGLSSQPSSSLDPPSPTKRLKVDGEAPAAAPQPQQQEGAEGSDAALADPTSLASLEQEWQEILTGR